MKLLSYTNAKTIKGEILGIKTAILYLSPGSLSGVNLCRWANKGCLLSCLNTSGMGAFSSVQKARLAKTRLYLDHNDEFMLLLRADIRSHIKRSEAEHLRPAIRLNGTSDVKWEETGIMEEFPQVQWYDYTKSPWRAIAYANGKLPKNYSLVFSRSGSNNAWVEKMPKKVNIAVVFDTAKGKSLPAKWMGRRVIDGDISDARFLDKRGVIVGLRAKGKGKNDASGFVVRDHSI
jgi:hypothetical protein